MGNLGAAIYRDTGKSLLTGAFRSYAEVKGNSTLVVPFMATVAGIKPAMDDWVRVERLDAYLRLCERFGLVTAVSSYFVGLSASQAAAVSGGERLTTTRAVARPPWDKPDSGEAHVFLARDPSCLDRAYANGWYTVAIADRVIDKPIVDHAQFAPALGYPDCCSAFFSEHNDWSVNNFYYVIRSASEGRNALCNPFTRHTPYAYVSHMPCRLDCSATAEYAGRVRASVRSDEPALAAAVGEFISLPILFLSEIHLYVFQGRADAREERITYTDYAPLPPTPVENELSALLARGDAVAVEGNVIRVFRSGRLEGLYEAKGDRVGPEAPCIVNWEGGT